VRTPPPRLREPAPRLRERRRRGRPAKFTPALGWQLVALLVAGASLGHACAEVGISVRTAQRWRARAWSRDPADAPYVEIERALWVGRVAAAQVGQRVIEDTRRPSWRRSTSC
jgi:hypothetical protein